MAPCLEATDKYDRKRDRELELLITSTFRDHLELDLGWDEIEVLDISHIYPKMENPSLSGMASYLQRPRGRNKGFYF